MLDSIDLPWEQARRNIVTRGIALNGLVTALIAPLVPLLWP